MINVVAIVALAVGLLSGIALQTRFDVTIHLAVMWAWLLGCSWLAMTCRSCGRDVHLVRYVPGDPPVGLLCRRCAGNPPHPRETPAGRKS